MVPAMTAAASNSCSVRTAASADVTPTSRPSSVSPRTTNRSAIGGVIMIVCARIDREFVEQRRVELGIVQEVGVGHGDDLERGPHQILVATGGDADAPNVERHRPEAFVIVDLAGSAILKNRDGPVANEIVEPNDGIDGQSIRRSVNRDAAGGENRFAGSGQEKRREQFGVGPIGE
jgi:hypothetical protein